MVFKRLIPDWTPMIYASWYCMGRKLCDVWDAKIISTEWCQEKEATLQHERPMLVTEKAVVVSIHALGAWPWSPMLLVKDLMKAEADYRNIVVDYPFKPSQKKRDIYDYIFS